MLAHLAQNVSPNTIICDNPTRVIRDPNIVALRVKGSTTFHFVTDGGHRKNINLLINKGARLDAVDQLGLTLLHRSAGLGLWSSDETVHSVFPRLLESLSKVTIEWRPYSALLKLQSYELIRAK